MGNEQIELSCGLQVRSGNRKSSPDLRANYDSSPVLLNASEGETSFPAEWNVYDFGFNTSIRLVVNSFFPASHPMHLHGHNFYVLSESSGPWDGSIVNAANPQRRDVQLLQPGSTTVPSHMVIQFDADNPGVWPFHCHIAWHVSAGLYVNILVGGLLPVPLLASAFAVAPYTNVVRFATVGETRPHQSEADTTRHATDVCQLGCIHEVQRG